MFEIKENTNIDTGLLIKDVEKNKNKYGINILTSKKKDSFFKLLLESLGDPIIKILLIALAIKVIFLFKDRDWYETIGIVIAIFLASFISSISEYGSEKAFLRLQEESSKIKCRVKRNRKVIEVCVEDVVVGDIVMLQAGDKIPADGLLIKGNVETDEASLTGEAKEIKKKIKDPLYKGTVVVNNTGVMLVTNVGDDTFYGRIATELQEISPESPLKTKLRGLAKIISRIGYIAAFLVTFSFLFKMIVINNDFDINKISIMLSDGYMLFNLLLHALTLAVTIIVVAVPEGLPMMITLVLSSNMKRMLKNNVLVRKLTGIETAGSINILYSDKTGTLTKGKLEVTQIILGNKKIFKNQREIYSFQKYNELLETSIIYNTESRVDDNNKVIGGNTTEKCLMEFIKKDFEYKYKVLDSTPFNSEQKYSSSIIDKNKKTILIKGAFEKIIKNCTYYYDEFGEKKKLNIKNELDILIKEKLNSGERILALAENNNYYSEEKFKDLTLVGLVCIKDEIRKEAIEGIELVNSAHIKTVMITGDNLLTASSIAKELGLVKDEKDVVLTSEELNKMSDEEVKKIIPFLKVVARSMPQDKSRLIRLSQELDLVVGMTGDGVNDAPALKKADVGFSMGSGTEVAKEASDIVILDDNFLSISNSILFGRTIFKSIRKFIIFQLTVNFCAVGLSIIGPFIGVDTPVTVIQMLWINMVMDTLAGLAFAYEPPLKEYMKELPKKRNQGIINKYMASSIFWMGSYSLLVCILFLKAPIIHNLFRTEIHDTYLMSAFFGLFIFMAIFNSFNARTHRLNIVSNILKNKVFLFIIGFITLVQIYLIYFGGELFRTTGLTIFELEIMILIAFSVIPIDMLRKYILRLRKNFSGV